MKMLIIRLSSTRNRWKCLKGCFVEPSLAKAAPGSRYQFERLGYFCVDPDAKDSRMVFNRTVTLKDEWAKIERAEGPERKRISWRSGMSAAFQLQIG